MQLEEGPQTLTHHLVIVDDQHADLLFVRRHGVLLVVRVSLCTHHGALAGGGDDLERPADLGGALTHASQAHPRPAAARRPGRSRGPGRGPRAGRARAARSRTCACAVPACLATLFRASWAMRKRPCSSARRERAPRPRRPARPSSPSAERPTGEMPAQRDHEAALGRRLGAQLGDQHAHLGERGVGQRREAVELPVDSFAVVAGQQQERPGGEGHGEDRLRDRVVQLARDPAAFLGDGEALDALGRGLQLAIDLAQAAGERLGARALLPGRPGRPRVESGERIDGAEGQCGHERHGEVVLVVDAQRRERHEESDAHDGLPERPALDHLHAEHGEQHGEVVGLVRERQQDDDQRRLQRHVEHEEPGASGREELCDAEEHEPGAEQQQRSHQHAVLEDQHRAQQGGDEEEGRREIEDGGI